jgi:hypothetical protein
MHVRSCFRRPRAGSLATALMLAVVAGCSRDDPATGPDPELPLDRIAEPENLDADRDVRADAVSHYADGYVWAFLPTTASYDAGSSGLAFNRSGGAITISRQGEGIYTVRFAGLSAVLGSKSTVHVTGFVVQNTYCKPANEKLLSDVVHIKCFSAASGRPADAYYTVYITKRYSDRAFAFANQPTTNDYAPPAGASHNPSGAIRVFRNNVGVYFVRFTGFGTKLTGIGGHPQAVAIGTGAQHCKVGSWGGSPDLIVTVQCYSRDGLAKDVKFNLFFATPNPHLAYAWADQPTAASYSPNSFNRSNPSGGGVTITRSGAGRYAVTWSGLALLDDGDVQVTAVGFGNVVCTVEGWNPTTAFVRCFNPGTNVLVDAIFNVMYLS